jgi:hypothetical protein
MQFLLGLLIMYAHHTRYTMLRSPQIVIGGRLMVDRTNGRLMIIPDQAARKSRTDPLSSPPNPPTVLIHHAVCHILVNRPILPGRDSHYARREAHPARDARQLHPFGALEPYHQKYQAWEIHPDRPSPELVDTTSVSLNVQEKG